jgi:hypothetical protein
MKTSMLATLICLSAPAFAQESLPVIRATSAKAAIYMQDRPGRRWNIEPAQKLDVFETPKMATQEQIRFKTDSDSIVFTLKPGTHKDFVVLLNDKDSCLTRIQSPALLDFSQQYPALHDTIPMYINEHNTMYIAAVLNGTDTLWLNFDTGSSDITLKEGTIAKLKTPLDLYSKPYDLQIGTRHYTSPVFDTKLSGHGTEGRFGWNLFDGYVVELNYDKGIMVVHGQLPKAIAADKKYTRLPMHYIDNIFLVRSSLQQGKTKLPFWFLYDSGYQRTAMLDNDLLKETQFPAAQMKELNRVIMRDGRNKEIPVITANLEQLHLGNYTLKQVPVQVQTANKPLAGLNIHILGNEVLKRFNTVLDFQHNVVYMKPGQYFNDPYIVQKPGKS